MQSTSIEEIPEGNARKEAPKSVNKCSYEHEQKSKLKRRSFTCIKHKYVWVLVFLMCFLTGLFKKWPQKAAVFLLLCFLRMFCSLCMSKAFFHQYVLFLNEHAVSISALMHCALSHLCFTIAAAKTVRASCPRHFLTDIVCKLKAWSIYLLSAKTFRSDWTWVQRKHDSWIHCGINIRSRFYFMLHSVSARNENLRTTWAVATFWNAPVILFYWFCAVVLLCVTLQRCCFGDLLLSRYRHPSRHRSPRQLIWHLYCGLQDII